MKITGDDPYEHSHHNKKTFISLYDAVMDHVAKRKKREAACTNKLLLHVG